MRPKHHNGQADCSALAWRGGEWTTLTKYRLKIKACKDFGVFSLVTLLNAKGVPFYSTPPTHQILQFVTLANTQKHAFPQTAS